jgi:glutamate-1-semialdehyde 2,1-aminomutase
VVLPVPGFLPGLRDLCREFGALLILDEVMTGFRVAPGGGQALWGLDPDLTCLGKVIGGGLPVGAYAGKRAIMELVAPQGPVYQAGTLAGNPLAMAAGLATLRTLGAPGVFDAIARRTAQLVTGLRAAAADAGIPVQATAVGTMFGLFFLNDAGAAVVDQATATANADAARYGRFFHAMLRRGIALAPSPFEAGFLSSAHQQGEVQATLAAARGAFRDLLAPGGAG